MYTRSLIQLQSVQRDGFDRKAKWWQTGYGLMFSSPLQYFCNADKSQSGQQGSLWLQLNCCTWLGWSHFWSLRIFLHHNPAGGLFYSPSPPLSFCPPASTSSLLSSPLRMMSFFKNSLQHNSVSSGGFCSFLIILGPIWNCFFFFTNYRSRHERDVAKWKSALKRWCFIRKTTK